MISTTDSLPHQHLCVLLPMCYFLGDSWIDQDETWHAGRPRTWQTGTQLPSPKGAQRPPQFSARVCCGQMAGWIKTPLGVEVGLGPRHIVLHGDPAPPPKKGAQPPIFGPCLLWPDGNAHLRYC